MCAGLTRALAERAGGHPGRAAALAGEMGHADGYKGEPSPIAICGGAAQMLRERPPNILNIGRRLFIC